VPNPRYWAGDDQMLEMDHEYLKRDRPRPPEFWWTRYLAQLFGFARPFDIARAIMDQRIVPPRTRECRAFVLQCYGYPPSRFAKRLDCEGMVDAASLAVAGSEWFARHYPTMYWAHKVNTLFVEFRHGVEWGDENAARRQLEEDPLHFHRWGILTRTCKRAILDGSMPADTTLKLGSWEWYTDNAEVTRR